MVQAVQEELAGEPRCLAEEFAAMSNSFLFFVADSPG